jgi:hypothetical protein
VGGTRHGVVGRRAETGVEHGDHHITAFDCLTIGDVLRSAAVRGRSASPTATAPVGSEPDWPTVQCISAIRSLRSGPDAGTGAVHKILACLRMTPPWREGTKCLSSARPRPDALERSTPRVKLPVRGDRACSPTIKAAVWSSPSSRPRFVLLMLTNQPGTRHRIVVCRA